MFENFAEVRKSFGELILLFFAVTAVFSRSLSVSAQSSGSVAYHQLEGCPFVYVAESFTTTPPDIPDSLFDHVARGLRFKVNRTELMPNDPFVAYFNDTLVPLLKEMDLVLCGVIVKGAASPEGPYDNNVRLSRERTRRLVEFLEGDNADLKISESSMSSNFITEDYGYLVTLMRQAGDPEAEAVAEIWKQCNGDERMCKQKLRALNGGRTWKRLLDKYFPTLRQSRVVMWYAPHPMHVSQGIRLQPEDRNWAPLPNLEFNIQPPRKIYTRRHMVAVRTNLIHDLLAVPKFGFAPGANVQLEYYPLDGHYTFNAGFTFTNHRHWNDYKFFQVRDGQLELRRYFKGGGEFLGTYLSAYAEGTVYGIGFNKQKGWEGEGSGLGLGIGYTCPLNKKGDLRLEFSLSLGAFVTRYDPYVYGNPLNGVEDGLYYYNYHGSASDFKERNHRFVWLGPTNAGIHLTYDIIYRKKKEVTL